MTLSPAEINKILYINWEHEAEVIELNAIDYHKKLEELKGTCKRILSINGGRTLREQFPKNSFDEYVPKKYRDKRYRIYCNENGILRIYETHKFGKTIHKDNQQSPYDLVVNRFKERTQLGLRAMSLAFGTVEYNYRNCVPDPLYYYNPIFASPNIETINIFKANSIDACSQYPTALCGLLPTAIGALEIKGRKYPTKEYPFALYLKSGHVAVYGEFDTHCWKVHTWAPIIFRHNDKKEVDRYLPDDQDITILMKASKYNFKEEMEYFFNIKESYPKDSQERTDAKLVMNAFIGTMWMKNPSQYAKRKFAHLVAVAQSRAVNTMLSLLNKINYQHVIHVCVDGIIYYGDKKLGVNYRKLGAFEQEFYDADFVMRTLNTYIAKQDGNVIKSKHGSYDIYKDGRVIIGDLQNYEDLYNITTTNNSGLYDGIREYKEKRI